MKKLVNLFGLIILAALAGYGAYWYVLTSQAENKFTAELAEWQSKHPDEKFTYDSLSKEGFPGHIKLRIENPQYSYRKPDSKERFDAKLLGTLTMSKSLWNSERSIELQGESTLLFQPIEGGSGIPPKLTWKGYTALNLEGDLPGHFELFQEMLSHNKEEQDDKNLRFRSWISKWDEYHFKGEIDKETPIEAHGGPFDAKIALKDYKKDQQEILFDFNQKDLTVNAPSTRAIISTLFYSPSDLGKMSFKIDGSVCYPHPSVMEKYSSYPLSSKDAELCFKLDRFNFVSDLMKSDTQNMVISLQQEQNKWNFTFKGFSEGSYTKEYDEAVRKNFLQLLKDPEYLKQFVGDDKEAQKKIMEAAPEIVDLLPSASSFGNVSAKVDLVGNAEVNDNLVDLAHFDLKALEYNVPPYNLNLIGKADFKKNFSDPVAQGSLKVTRYKQLIEQLSNFSNRVVAIYNNYKGAEQEAFPTAKPEDIKKVLSFLRAISDEPNKEGSDLRVSFSYNDQDSWKVGTLSMPDFIGKAYALYISLIPTTPPPKEAEVE